jgi:hypothetical protein
MRCSVDNTERFPDLKRRIFGSPEGDLKNIPACVRVEVVTAVTTMNGVFWNVAPCCSCETDVSKECITTLLWNVGSNKNHTASHPRRRSSS